MSSGVTLPLVTALEAIWLAIQERHPDVPDVVLTLGAGSLGERAGQLRLGHFAADRWQHGEHERLPELFVGGEGLQRRPVEILGTLLHEAAHAVAHVRGIKDTSRQGRFHNTRFKALAEELGITVATTGNIGWSNGIVPETIAAGAEVGPLCRTRWGQPPWCVDDKPSGGGLYQGDVWSSWWYECDSRRSRPLTWSDGRLDAE